MTVELALVTGASGFVGRHILAPLAAAGFEVHATARRVPPWAESNVQWHACDLLEPGAGASLIGRIKPALLVHAAWYARHGLFWTAPENGDWVRATVALAEAFRDCGGRRFVGIGSCAEYDWHSPGSRPWHETHPLGPATSYGRAKCAAAIKTKELTLQRGVEHAWARLFHLFGVEEQPGRLVPSVILALLAGEEACVGSGRAVRDFCDTAFAGRALAALAASPVTGPVNIGSGTSLRIADIVQTIAELCARPDLLRLGALPDRPEDPAYMVADVGRLRGEVGFLEQPDLRAQLAAAVQWWRDSRAG
jgi:nucleoside-diphosphate-sugar epimerase